MNISLTENDLSQMPPALRTSLLRWQMSKMSATGQTPVRQHPCTKETVNQLSLQFEAENQVPPTETNSTHVNLILLYGRWDYEARDAYPSQTQARTSKTAPSRVCQQPGNFG